MNRATVLSELKNLAERLGVTVVERVLLTTPVRVKSGLCVVRGKPRIIIDRKIPDDEKITVLATSLSELSLDDVFVKPGIRDLITRHARKREAPHEGGA